MTVRAVARFETLPTVKPPRTTVHEVHALVRSDVRMQTMLSFWATALQVLRADKWIRAVFAYHLVRHTPILRLKRMDSGVIKIFPPPTSRHRYIFFD